MTNWISLCSLTMLDNCYCLRGWMPSLSNYYRKLVLTIYSERMSWMALMTRRICASEIEFATQSEARSHKRSWAGDLITLLMIFLARRQRNGFLNAHVSIDFIVATASHLTCVLDKSFLIYGVSMMANIHAQPLISSQSHKAFNDNSTLQCLVLIADN